MVFIHNINPVLLHLGPLEVRYYGLIYVIGFIIAYYMMLHFAKNKYINFTKKEISDLIFYLVLGMLIGARLLYVIVYNLPYYISSPLDIFAVWQGGMSFHGGFLGALIGGLLYRRKKNFNFWKIADLAMIPVALNLCLGRIGNFINGELYGRITNLPWGTKFPNVEGYRHPSQLYESAKNFVIFGTLWFLKDKSLPPGFLFWTFVMMYGFLRFFIEFVRQPDPQLGFIVFNLSMGQLLTLPMFLLGLYMIIRLKRKNI